MEAKKKTRETVDGQELQGFRTLWNALSTQCWNICEVGEGGTAIEVKKLTDRTPLQEKAFELLDSYGRQDPESHN